ncbi:MAG: reductive dehalogenase domain-containing protein [Myxococcota bacterium]|nr:reductive dehalogenase domain-containing protein [Myxococcota bacterium]
MSDERKNPETPKTEAPQAQSNPPAARPSPPASSGGESLLDDPSRRLFFKRAAIGGGAALLGGGATFAFTQRQIQGSPVDDSAVFQTDETFKPKDQRDVILAFAASAKLQEKHPERSEMHSKYITKGFDYHKAGMGFEKRLPFDNSKVGFTQKDRALHHAAWYPLTVSGVEPMKFCQPDTMLLSWDQSDVEEEQYQFSSPQEAATSIKSAARVWGAVRCGITRRDRRWDYDPLYDMLNERELSWEKDFPFEPKTVIVILVPMDYDNIQTAPAWTAEGSVGHGYVIMAQIANQVAKFLRGMGYHAVGAGNDLGNSVAYGIAAGLGQGGRNAQLLVPGLGPRHRICKVYTDFEDVEYDQPHDWGITQFCLSCGECAKSCPSDALPMLEEEDSGYGFHPKYEHHDVPGYTWNNHTGVKKFYSDAKKCYDFWIENDSACGNCIASCTYNEPDYWHHWLSMASTTIAPGFLHHTMSKMHPLFGYGVTGDPAKVDKFWKTGEGMRVNPSSKNNMTTAGKA